MKKLFSIAVVLVFSLSLATGVFAAAPKGTLTVAINSLGTEKWVVCMGTFMDNVYLWPLYESLLQRDWKTGKILPEGHLATSWSMSPDGKAFTFNLRKGVQFHDGWGEMTAEDVKFTFELIMSKESGSDNAGWFRQIIDRIEIVNPYKIVVHMKKPAWGFQHQLVNVPQITGIVSKKHIQKVGLEKAHRHPIGTGPYKFVEHVFGDYIKLEAVDSHWRKTPSIKYLTLKKIPEMATRVAMLRAGEADITQIGYDMIEEVEAAGKKVTSMERASLMVVHLLGQYLNPTYKERPPWAQGEYWVKDSPAYKVRRALSLAINREDIVQYALKGRGGVEGATAASFFAFHPGYDPSGVPDPYDPKRAKQLLAEAGYANPSDLEFTVELAPHPARPFGSMAMEAIAMMWQEMGIKIKMQRTEYPSHLAKVKARSANVAWGYAQPAFAEAIILLGYFTRSTDRYSYTGESRELDGLMAEGFGATTLEDRAKAQHKIWKYLYENVPSIPVCYADLLVGTNPKLVWPRLPGFCSLGHAHNFEYMYYED